MDWFSFLLQQLHRSARHLLVSTCTGLPYLGDLVEMKYGTVQKSSYSIYVLVHGNSCHKSGGDRRGRGRSGIFYSWREWKVLHFCLGVLHTSSKRYTALRTLKEVPNRIQESTYQCADIINLNSRCRRVDPCTPMYRTALKSKFGRTTPTTRMLICN